MSSKPMVYPLDDGRICYRPSSLGIACRRELVAIRIGVRPSSRVNEQTQQWFDEGHLHEPDVITRLRKRYGLDVDDSQSEVELELPEIGVVLRGHIDGMVRRLLDGNEWDGERGDVLLAPDADVVRSYTQPRLVEVKARSKGQSAKWIAERFAAFPGMAMQVSVYMYATALPAIICNKSRDSGALDIFPVDEPPVSLADLTAYLSEIELAAMTAKPDGRNMPECDIRRYPCSTSWLCSHRLNAVTASSDDDQGSGSAATDDLITSLHAEYLTARKNADAAKARVDEVKEQLLNALDGRDKWSLGGRKVTVVRSVRQIPDVARLKDFHGPDWDAFTKESASTIVKVTEESE